MFDASSCHFNGLKDGASVAVQFVKNIQIFVELKMFQAKTHKPFNKLQ